MAFPVTSFATTNDNRFFFNGQPYYVHGFNAYFLMAIGVDPQNRSKVSSLLQEAAETGLNVARTWAFNDGGYQALQSSPGVYDEKVFQALDFAVSEAARAGVLLILTLVNNWKDYGGKSQYVEWACKCGATLDSEDAFFTNSTVKEYYKNHVKKVLTRINTITGVSYRDDPTIFAWELINEARCTTDPSGDTLQAWIEEMASYVKGIDSNHLLGTGSEGFYGNSDPTKVSANPNTYAQQVGTDFLRNHQVAGIDFAGAHAYPDDWLGSDPTVLQQNSFVENWLATHIADCTSILNMPFLFGEFGMSDKRSGYKPENRESFLATIYTVLYISALSGGAGAGGMVWQLFPQGLESFNDGYQIVLSKDANFCKIIKYQSERLKDLTGADDSPRRRKDICPIKLKCWW